MNNIKMSFSIKDLENLTGIKAHTIRIWEKRYNLLQPNRSETNIRTYSLSSLQKLLNISFLNNSGYKISKIAQLTDQEIPKKVNEIANSTRVEDHAINAFKMSMLNFDQDLFYKTYEELIRDKSFTEIFHTVFIPLLNDLGLLWQTDTITPAHEHFLTAHIKQKVLINIERLESLQPRPKTKTFILFLPDNEIHDLGLLFINYQLREKGYHTIFLGDSIPMDSLTHLLQFFDDITFISYFTVYPEENEIINYINAFKKALLTQEKTNFIVLGPKLANINISSFPSKVKSYKSIESLLENIEPIKTHTLTYSNS